MNLIETMQAMDQAIQSSINPATKIWLDWMSLTFVMSLLFVWKFPPARVAFLTILVSLVAAVFIFAVTSEPHLIGIGHIVIWTPFLVYLYKKVYKNPEQVFIGWWQKFYAVWLTLLALTMFISLVFDVRDVVLVFMGKK